MSTIISIVAGFLVGLLLFKNRQLTQRVCLAEHEAQQQRGVALETDRVWTELGEQHGFVKKEGEDLSSFLNRHRR